MIEVGDLVTIPYLYTDGEYGVGVVIGVGEEKKCSKKIFILWSEHPSEWVSEELLNLVSKGNKEDK